MSVKRTHGDRLFFYLYLLLIVIMFALLSGCKSAQQEPKAEKPKCATIACMRKEAKSKYFRACIKGFQVRAMKRWPLIVLPYDDGGWQFTHCHKKARRAFR